MKNHWSSAEYFCLSMAFAICIGAFPADEPKLTPDEIRFVKEQYQRIEGQAMLNRAIAKKNEDAVESLTMLDKLAMQFAGDDIGTKAKQESDTLKKDPKVKKEVEAAFLWKKIENQLDIMNIVGGCKMLLDRYPDTKSAGKAKELMEQLQTLDRQHAIQVAKAEYKRRFPDAADGKEYSAAPSGKNDGGWVVTASDKPHIENGQPIIIPGGDKFITIDRNWTVTKFDNGGGR